MQKENEFIDVTLHKNIDFGSPKFITEFETDILHSETWHHKEKDFVSIPNQNDYPYQDH